MTKNQLVPTTITDKNGKITTVHKKQHSTPASRPLPSPSKAPDGYNTPMLRVTLMERTAALYDKSHQSGFDYRTALMADIKAFSTRTLQLLERYLYDDSIAESVAEQIVHGTPENALIETAHYYKKTGSTDFLLTAAEVQALGHYSFVGGYEDLSVVDEEVQQQCIALMKFTRLIDTLPESPSPFLNYEDSGAYDLRIINDPSLVNLIGERPNDVDRIAELVLKHGTSNGAAIKGIMEGMNPTTAEGYL